MRGKIQLWTMTAGLVLYILDLVSDIIVCVQHAKNSDIVWFLFTFALISFSSVVLNIIAMDQLRREDKLLYGEAFLIFSSFSVLHRYFEEYKLWKKINHDISPCADSTCTCDSCAQWYKLKRKSAESAYSLAWIRYLETTLESAPQWCLQTYIMLRQWRFPWYTVLSTVLSFLSSVWNITMLERTREIEENGKFKLKFAASFLLWQLFLLTSRLSAIVIFAYVLSFYVFVFLVIHWLLLLIIAYVINGQISVREACVSYNYLFHSSKATSKEIVSSRFRRYENRKLYKIMIVYCILLTLADIVMMTLAVTMVNSSVPHMDILRPVAITCVVGGLLLGSIFSVVHNTECCQPVETVGGQMGIVAMNSVSPASSAFHIP